MKQVVDKVWRIESQHALASLPHGVAVKNSIRSAHDPARRSRVSETKSGGPVVEIRMDERAKVRAAVLGEDHPSGGWIEVRELIVCLRYGCCVFVANSKVQRQSRARLVIVLHKAEVHILALVHDGVRGQREL